MLLELAAVGALGSRFDSCATTQEPLGEANHSDAQHAVADEFFLRWRDWQPLRSEAVRGWFRRSGAGTQRVRYTNVSDAQTGHCWLS